MEIFLSAGLGLHDDPGLNHQIVEELSRASIGDEEETFGFDQLSVGN